MIVDSNIAAMQALQVQFHTSAVNVARSSIPDAKALDARMVGGPGDSPAVKVELSDRAIDLTKELTDQLMISHNFKANAKVIEMGERMTGTVIDLLA